ncbi:hypothetical protein ILUMI_25979 [Ignelater luminosus]|uniref:Eukaryotic translation initiation factor 4 gamma n=1 Tax=Ignelater luminosus TaxID=2038154 RepID=A0A8K0C4R5_IGNLU|nr:hypothetical protein ILUMI_25979 [Ignelater luminosus]
MSKSAPGFMPQRPPTPPAQRPDGYRVTPSYVTQQPPNQANNQVQSLRAMPPTGPPTQSSTPPNSDLKVQQLSQQPPMNIAYVSQPQVRSGAPNYFPRTLPTTTQTPKMANHRQGQQPLYQTQPTQYVPMAALQPTAMYLNPSATPVQYFNGGPRPQASFVTPGYQMIPSQHISYPFPQAPSQPQAAYVYNSSQLLQRPSPQVTSAAQSLSKIKLTLTDLHTGKDKLSEMDEQEQDDSHPPFGESSARQTPQPPLPNPNKEVQAAFVKQIMNANENNRKVYDKEFLLSLRHAPSSMKKPENLPADIMAGYLTNDDKEMKIFQAQAEDLLSSLNEKNLYNVLDDLECLDINSSFKIHIILDLIFEKVMNQNDFATIAATLCKELCYVEYVAKNIKEYMNFKILLINRCKFLFQNNLINKTERFEKVEEVEKCQDLDYKKELEQKLKHYDHNSKQEFLKTLNFIGELFKNNIIPYLVIMDFLEELFKRKDEKSIECICVLLATIGDKLDRINPRLESFLSEFEVFVKRNKYDVELGNMIQDVIGTTNVPEEKSNEKKYEDEYYQVKSLHQKLETSSNENYGREVAATTSKMNDELSQHPINIKQALKEYIDDDGCSLEKYENSIKMLLPDLDCSQLVFEGCMDVLEISKVARLRIGFLFNHLIKLGTITFQDYCTGLHKVLEEADDLSLDVQNIWEYIAELVVPITCDDDTNSIRLMHKLIKLLANSNGGTKVLTYMFKLIIQEKEMLKAAPSDCIIEPEITDSKSLQNSRFLPDSKVLISSLHDQSYRQNQISCEDIEKKMISFFESDTSFEEIKKWVSENLNKAFMKDKFIRILATACFKNSAVALKIQTDVLEKRYNLLIDLIDGDISKELQCLHALQVFAHEMNNPEGLLLDVCQHLYENNVISYESFFAWEKNTDPSEQMGKVEALKQLAEFLSLLRLSYEDDSKSY